MNSFRSVTNSALSSNFYRTEEDADNGVPSISLRGNRQEAIGNSDKTVIMFGVTPSPTLPQMGKGEPSSEYGVNKLMNTDESVPNIYSLRNNQNFSINFINQQFNNSTNLTIPLGFDVNTSGNYTINASEIINFPSGTHIYLEDLTHNVIQDLTGNPNYTFTINKGDAGGRFYIKFGVRSSEFGVNAVLFDAYSLENVLVVNYNNPDNSEATLSIFNILGQQVKEIRIENGVLRINLAVAPGAYMVRLVTNDKVYIKKVYLQ
jgi:hypothetical protein